MEDLFYNFDSEDSDDCIHIATDKNFPVKRGPTRRSHGIKSSTSMFDYLPSCNENFDKAEDSEYPIELPVVLPNERKSRAKKKKKAKDVV